MKQKAITLLLLTLTCTAGKADKTAKIISRSDSSITFTVDEGLPPIDHQTTNYLLTGKSLALSILAEEDIPKEQQHITATSFDNETNLYHMGKDAFYRTIVKAYANHQSIALSPDMIWLVICQGFARYVNAHPEEMRPLLVSHQGKMDLAIILPPASDDHNTDWPTLIDQFAQQIQHHTKGQIAQTITADFTTTTTIERVASQITLMESVKPYFQYIVYRIACGIPSITLQGTPDDWQRLLDKTRQLRNYGLHSWIDSLIPILNQFIQAANGQPDQAFWKEIVKKQPENKLTGGGCSPGKPTQLDGWILKLFPDNNGLTTDKQPHTKDMPAEYVRVNFKYRVINPNNGTIISETPMELWAGFIGAQADNTNTLTPKIGWLVRQAESNDETLDQLQKNNNEWGLDLRVQEVPPMLQQLQHIKRLHLVFTGKVDLPQWMDDLTIDQFIIEGDMTEAEQADILKRFPNINILH